MRKISLILACVTLFLLLTVTVVFADESQGKISMSKYENYLSQYSQEDALAQGIEPEHVEEAIVEAQIFYEEFMDMPMKKREMILSEVNDLRDGKPITIDYSESKISKTFTNPYDMNALAVNGFSIEKTGYSGSGLIAYRMSLGYKVENGKIKSVGEGVAYVVRNIAVGTSFSLATKQTFISDNQACIRTRWSQGIGIDPVNIQYGIWGHTIGGDIKGNLSYNNTWAEM
ncbi:MAG: hypothetical protein RR313_08505 [Anaerovoracaceae bacterium]